MYEVEVKVPADHEAVERCLRELDAERRGAVRQVDTYYDPPHRDFAATDEALRIREETSEPDQGSGEADDPGTVHRLTYKGPKVDADSKTRAEHESGIADAEAVRAALRALGFDPVATVSKDRTRYALRGYTVTLDRVDGLGEFVEVEREAQEAEIEAVRDGAVDLLGTLGLDPGDGVRRSYLGLLLDADG